MDEIDYWLDTPPPEILDADEAREWRAKWAPCCPDGDPQRVCEILGFRPKSVDLLQLRVVLRASDHGVCTAIVDEHPDHIDVRVLACMPDDTPYPRDGPAPKEMDCPIRVLLDAPLGTRDVIDIDTGEALPFYIPRFDVDGPPGRYIPRPPGNLWPPDPALR